VSYDFISKGIFRVTALGLLLAGSLFAEAAYSPHKYQQNDWFGEFGQNASMYVNPAGIVEADQFEASVGMYSTISGAAGQEFITAVYPIDYNHTIGVTFFENGAKIDNGDAYVENAYMIGYALRVIHALALGVDLSILQVNQFDLNKQITLGVDFGVSWNPIANSKFGFLQLGLAVQNLVPPAISTGDGSQSYAFVFMGAEDSYKIPTNLNASIFWRGLNRSLEAKAELSLIDIVHEEAEGGKGNNVEVSFTATYFLSPMLGVRGRLTKEGYPVLGATVNVKDVNVFRYLQLDLEMSHDDIIDSKNRGFIWSAKFTTRLGPTREEKIGDDRYRRLKIEPENDYREAMRLYLQRRFVEAAYAFGKVITKYPAFHLVDQAAYFKGKSFENMKMHKAARTTYNEAVQEYPSSDIQAKYLFQLMNIDYKEGKFAEATLKYQEIVQKYSETSVKADADYVMGQIKFYQGQYNEAINYLKPILPGNANYVYARYTVGIAQSRLNEFDKAKQSFQDIVDYQTSNNSEKELQDAARVKLGHIYFSAEPPDLATAAGLYKAVPSKSHVYDEALLALAWSLIKVGRAKDALPLVGYIIDKMPDSYLVPEAWLVRGYAYFILEDWNNTDRALRTCQSLVEKPLVSTEERRKAEADYNAMIGQFEEVQMTAHDLSRQLPTPRVQQKRSALQPKFDEARTAIDNHYEFLRRAEESDRFEKSRKRILDDARFTLAIVAEKRGGRGTGSAGGLDLELD